jgi:hypothetical protein
VSPLVDAPNHRADLPSGVLRIEKGTGGESIFAGTGFLVSTQYVVTCAHVVLGPAFYHWSATRRTAPPELIVRSAGGLDAYRAVLVDFCRPDAALIRLEEALPAQPVQLIVNLCMQHERAITRCGASVIGFSSSTPGELVESGIKRIISSIGAATTRRLIDVEIEGGRADGMSGSPVLVQVSGDRACIGILYRGGEDAFTSRFMAADGMLAMLDRHRVDYPPLLNADDAFVPTGR